MTPDAHLFDGHLRVTMKERIARGVVLWKVEDLRYVHRVATFTAHPAASTGFLRRQALFAIARRNERKGPTVILSA
jgi:hypothetical protein